MGLEFCHQGFGIGRVSVGEGKTIGVGLIRIPLQGSGIDRALLWEWVGLIRIPLRVDGIVQECM